MTEKQKHNDKKIKEAILNGLIDCRDAPDLGWSNFGGIHIDDCIAWLEKQGEQTKQTHFPKFTFDDILALQCCMETVKKVQEDKELYEKLNLIHSKMYDAYRLEKQGEQEQLYIRFGEIPTDEKSKIYLGEIEVGIENGVSVYPAFKTNEGNIVLGLNLPITKTTLHTQQHLVEYDNRPCYLVKGDYIGKDTDGQPLINNISIIEKIDNYRVKEKIGNIDNQNYKKIEEEKNNVCINKNIDLTKILKDCPKGWKFYSNKYGEVTFWGFSDLVYPIQLNTKNNGAKLLSEKGEEIIGNGKCILFPSKEQRDWSKFTAPWDKKDNLVNPKFKVGDWIISSVLGIAHIIGVNDSNEYQLEYIDGKQKFLSIDYVNYEYNKWTIKDAKDGDVVQLGQVIAIFKKYIGEEKCICYCSFCKDVGFEIPIENGEDNIYGCYNATPAIRKYRDYLMNAMNNAGYEWDIEKKDFKKLVPNRFDPNTLKPFDKVLVSINGEWQCDFFSHILSGDIFNKRCMGIGDMNVVIPYNDDTKHLVGIKEEAPEYYKYWDD